MTYSQGGIFKRPIPPLTNIYNKLHDIEKRTAKVLKVLDNKKQDFAARLKAAQWLKKNSHVLSAVMTTFVELIFDANQEIALLALEELAEIDDLQAFWFLQDIINWGPSDEIRYKAAQLSAMWEENNEQKNQIDEEILLLPPARDDVLLLPPAFEELLQPLATLNSEPASQEAKVNKTKKREPKAITLNKETHRPRLTVLRLQLLIGSLGIGLGWLQYQLLLPQPLMGILNWQTLWLSAVMLLMSIGYLEELLFRGLLQNTAALVMGRWRAIVLVGVLSTMIHAGYASLELLSLQLMINLLFGWFVARTHSIIGVTLARGLMYISLLLIWPLLFHH
jgi:hypothetical protein